MTFSNFRLERNLYKDIQISLNFKNLNIQQITGVSTGKEIDKETEVIYEDLLQNEYTIIGNQSLVQINKSMPSGYVHFIKIKTLQTDNTNDEFVVKVNGRGKQN